MSIHNLLFLLCTVAVTATVLDSSVNTAIAQPSKKDPPPDPKPTPKPTPTTTPADEPVETTGSYHHPKRASRAIALDEFHDAAFDPYVDISLIISSLKDGDVDLLIDVGLQLAEAERILQRPHKSAITSSSLLALAATIAGDKQNKDALARLAKAADKIQSKELAAQVTAVSKASGTSRAITPSVTVSLDSITVESAVDMKAALDTTRLATLLGDADLLDKVEAEIDSMPPDVRKLIKERIDRAREIISQKPGPTRDAAGNQINDRDESALRAIKRLAQSSRDIGLKNTPFDPGTWNPPSRLKNTPVDPGTWNPLPKGSGDNLSRMDDPVEPTRFRMTRWNYIRPNGQRGGFQKNGSTWVEFSGGQFIASFQEYERGINHVGIYDSNRRLPIKLSVNNQRAVMYLNGQWVPIADWVLVGHD